MAMEAMQWAWKQKGITASDKLVLLRLCDRASDDNDWKTWPRVASLVDETLLGERTVKRSLKNLCDAGLIVDTGERKGKARRTKVYRIIGFMRDMLGYEPEPKPDEKPASDKEVECANLSTSQNQRCQSGTIKSARVAPSPPANGARVAPSYIEPKAIETKEEPKEVARQPKAADAPPPTSRKQTGEKKPTTQVWEAYASAYRQRYGATPIRNAKVNGQLKYLISHVGLDRAIQLAANYPFHPDAYYTKRMHPVDLLLADAQKLNTELETGQVMTWQRAQQQERIQQAAVQAHQARAIQQQSTQPEERF